MKKPNHKPLREDRRASTSSNTPTVVHHDMQPARVTAFDARRGSGKAVLINAGRKVRIPWSALHAAGVVVLGVGDLVYLTMDGIDKNRAEAIRLPDS